ncbi:hypothetical protein E2C01_043747 [Portunus trituberculatus]|uniref:Uncharacterized protein n=1 Tax=Portunus trituberculatus TaxID=210409 RepID=A0A5B7FY56_PORTR|nr:hypothetical protein [Portunus trituberculatus]
MSQQRPPEGYWWSLGQQKLLDHCLKTADPIWRREDLGSDSPDVLPLLPVLLQTSPNLQRHLRSVPSKSPTAPRGATEEFSRAKGTTCLRSRMGQNRRRSNQCKVSGTKSMTSLSPDAPTCGSQTMSILGYKGQLQGLKLPLLHCHQSLTIKKVGANGGRHQLPSLLVTVCIKEVFHHSLPV